MNTLIVDDDMATVDAIEYTVPWDKLGITQVYRAYNIEQAKTILNDNAIDIIISDIEMPQGSGLDLLNWFREEKLSGEFLLLTCHERFDYATDAVKLHAAEYLLKPLDVKIMEAAIKKLVIKIHEERQLVENSEYGKWVKQNKRQLQIGIFDMLLTGKMNSNQEEIEREIRSRHLNLSSEEEYCLVITKATDLERDLEKMNPNLIRFIMENILSEVLCGNPENESVVCYDMKNNYSFVTVCKKQSLDGLMNRCNELIKESKLYLEAILTCCISNPCKLTKFYEVYHQNLRRLNSNVMYYGKCFLEDQGITEHITETTLFNVESMEDLLSQKKKMEFLSCTKERLNDKIFDKTLNEEMLRLIQQEILQIVYLYLGKKQIPLTGLFLDPILEQLSQKASQSVTDMIRWVNLLLDTTFNYEEERRKKYTIIDKINEYIKDHYNENIGRNEIAAEFFFAPEYLSKMYKKQTGKSLKDYISEYRIEQAKRLLDQETMRVSDVAAMVGFENFTYFSSMFKKYTGVSPNQYRKK